MFGYKKLAFDNICGEVCMYETGLQRHTRSWFVIVGQTYEHLDWVQ
jgi:hypothetical protein